MKTSTIIWIIVAVIVVGGAVWYLSSGTGTASPTATSTETGTTGGTGSTGGAGATGPGAPTTTGTGSISSLVTADAQLVCTVSTTSSGPKSTGTIYIAGGKMRGDFTSVVSGQTVHASMINDTQYIYTWTDLSNTGYKSPASVSASGSASATNGGIDPAESVSYDCRAWTPDLSFFVPPSRITFTTSK